jgi:SAM-dependent methyltransferase
MTGTARIVEADIAVGYGAWAAGYDAQDNPMIAAVDRHLGSNPLPIAGASVLDIGCGTGRLMAQALAAGAAFAAGIDGSAEMLARAEERLAASLAQGRARLVRGDLALPWDLPEAAFDLGVISLVLEHSPAVQPILVQAARHLAPGGLLFVAEIHPDMLGTPLGGHFERDGTVYALPSHPHRPEEFVAALAATGFEPPVFAEMRADPVLIAAVPKLAKRAGTGVLLTLRARRNAA